MTTSLVTGAAGFIGSHVADHLIRMGHKVVGLDDLSGGSMANVAVGAYDIRGSILNETLIDELFRKFEFDYVFHLAAYAAEALSHHIRHYNYMVNVVGSANLINAAINYGVKRFVFTSSAAVYGHSKEVSSENTKPEPSDPYAVAKYAIEMDLHNARAIFGLPFTIFRCHNVFGSRQNMGDIYRNAVAIFMGQGMRGIPMTVYGDGMQSREFSYIDDVSPYIAFCVNMTNAEDQIFNIGSSDPTSIIGLAEKVSDVLGIAPNIEFLPARAEVHHVWLQHSKFQMFFEPAPSTPLIDGLKIMAEWAKTNPARAPAALIDIEITKNLPAVWKDKVK